MLLSRSALAGIGLAVWLAMPALAAEPGGGPDALKALAGESAQAVASQGQPAAPDAGTLKAQIEAFVSQLETASNGLIKWEGADPFDIRQDGADTVIAITNARISIHAEGVAQLAFDRVEIRRSPDPDNDKLVRIAIAFPAQSTLITPDGTQTGLHLENASARALVEAGSGRSQESEISFASARLEQPSTGSWISLGPLTASSKLLDEAGGGWNSPTNFELKQIEFFFPQGPFGGTVDRVAYDGTAAGPHRADLDRLREQIDALHSGDNNPDAQMARFVDMLPQMAAVFSELRGQFECDGLAVRVATGEPIVALAKAAIGGEVTGLAGDKAALRLSLRHEGLNLSPTVLEQTRVPHRVVVDLGVENLATAALQTLLAASSQMRAGVDEAQRQRASQQVMGAVAMLDPVFRIYDVAFETTDAGVDITGEATGSPLSPKGYDAHADAVVRGFDALPNLAEGAPYAEYLPLLKELGVAAANGDPAQLTFHVASAPQRWITINGNDVFGWFGEVPPGRGENRVLKPAEPPMSGPDVAAVQRALAAAQLPAGQEGVYGPAAAVAVARFQRLNGLNISGVVDAATWQKLADKPAAGPAPGVRN
ncbi:MAG: peptidoglycan-binding protein [Alphaproteobacteria bacterium]|nr:peptidoglycan-binding protein [Alphaproteobacteria bacterium]